MIRQYGFNPKDIEILPEHYKYGAMSDRTILQPDGDWTPFLPKFEHQALRYETFGCTVYGTLTQIQMILKRLTGIEFDFSERYIYNLVGINPPGDNPHKILEMIRKKGLIEDSIMPYTETLDEFRTPRPMTRQYTTMGEKWLDERVLRHEWIASRDPVRMKQKIVESLPYGPPTIGVTARYLENGVYVDKGQDNTHWTVCPKAEVKISGINLGIADSYPPYEKLLHKDHFISYAKKVTIAKRTHKRQRSLLDWLRALRWTTH